MVGSRWGSMAGRAMRLYMVTWKGSWERLPSIAGAPDDRGQCRNAFGYEARSWRGEGGWMVHSLQLS